MERGLKQFMIYKHYDNDFYIQYFALINQTSIAVVKNGTT